MKVPYKVKLIFSYRVSDSVYEGSKQEASTGIQTLDCGCFWFRNHGKESGIQKRIFYVKGKYIKRKVGVVATNL